MELALPEKVCECLKTFCGKCGLTLDVLLACLIGDITGGAHTQGSDERMYAGEWFNNVYSQISQGDTLLHYLLEKDLYGRFMKVLEGYGYYNGLIKSWKLEGEPDFDELDKNILLLKEHLDILQEMLHAYKCENPTRNVTLEVGKCIRWQEVMGNLLT